MGHGDKLAIGDRSFPAESIKPRCVRTGGHRDAELLDAVKAFYACCKDRSTIKAVKK